MPSIHSIQTFVRVIYSDGVVGGLMAPSAELNPTSSVPQAGQAIQLMEQQARAIRDQFGEIGPNGMYDAAVASTQVPAKKHETPRPKEVPERTVESQSSTDDASAKREDRGGSLNGDAVVPDVATDGTDEPR